MDIFSHGLWAGAASKGVNLKSKKQLNVWLVAFWGVFPDLFAFTIPFAWLIFNLLTGKLHFQNFPQPGAIEPDGRPKFFGNGDTRQAYSLLSYLVALLYGLSHSLVIFLVIAGIIILSWKFFQKPGRLPWEMGGWLFHILLDIPTHTYRFFPTPLFWPLAGWKFDGFSWANPVFLIINYSAIAAVYTILWYANKKREKIPI